MLKFMLFLPLIALPQQQTILPQKNDKRCRKLQPLLALDKRITWQAFQAITCDIFLGT